MNIFDDIFYTNKAVQDIMDIFKIPAKITDRKNVLNPRTGKSTFSEIEYNVEITPVLRLKKEDKDKIENCDGYIMAEAKQFESLNIDYKKAFFTIYNNKFEVVEFDEIYSGEKLPAIKFYLKK